ncbi:MAG: hypothetical protein DMG57_30870 [Acidobacteria bacterium]|nr:MAG: hypothetical protein DMG57_30870 [Acidobacteriota bacterium]
MKFFLLLFSLVAVITPVTAETIQEHGKRTIDEAVAALGGEAFLNMADRIETGRAYSFYREELSGLSIARIYTRYLTRPEPPVPDYIGVRERQTFGKNEESGAVLFADGQGFEVSFRGARPIPDKTLERYKESTLRNIFYILRQRLGEPGLIFEYRGTDVIENQSADIVDITDATNRIVTVYFGQITHVPFKQVTVRRDPETKLQIEEVTRFAKYRDVGGVMWPYDIQRERNGEKIYQMYSDSVAINRDLKDDLFTLPSNMKILKKQK